MSRSRAQKFASSRNWANGTLTGMNTNLRKMKKLATEEEKEIIDDCLAEIKSLQSLWVNNYEQAKKEVL